MREYLRTKKIWLRNTVSQNINQSSIQLLLETRELCWVGAVPVVV